MNGIVRSSAALAVLAAAAGCTGRQASPETVQSIERRLAGKAPPSVAADDHGAQVWKAAQQFYRARGHQPAWIERTQPLPAVDELAASVEAVAADGLDPADYDLEPLAILREKSGGLFKRRSVTPDQAAEADLRLTCTFLKLASHLLTGRIAPGAVDPHWFGQARQVDLEAVLERALGGSGVSATLSGLAPQHAQYRLLKEALARYRSGASPAAAEAGAGASSAQPRVRQIELNLERWRWLPEKLGDRHILVNVPMFTLEAVEGGQPALTMRVVTGERENPTPIFSDQMTTVVFSPYWNIPAKIARQETIPAVLRDPDYLYKNDLEIVRGSRVVDPRSVDWDADDPDFRIRQRPGSKNSLGRVKFVFPNTFDVYLHDTPADALFERMQRAFSHGCVRVERPFALAQWVLRGQAEWTPEKIEAAMQAGDERHVKVERPVPVYIVYQTAWAEADGKVRFADDLYGHDARQLRLLAPSAPPPAQRVARR
jgi:murein L,D-transpeptidase YcbB/YkuD